MPSSHHLIALFPVLVLAATACALMLSEAFLKSGERRYQAALACAAAALSFAGGLYQLGLPHRVGPILKGAAQGDFFQAFVSATIAAGLFLSVLLSASYLRRLQAERGEYYALLLFAASGMQLLAMSNDLVMMFIALEVMSLATYALAAWLRRGQRTTEAAFKYFLLGAFSSAVFLYGIALVWGATGTTNLSDLSSAGARHHPELLGPALALIVAAFGFKVAAVPFHMWAPDVYEGAPTPVTAFMAAGVKAAAFAAMFRTLAVGFGGAAEKWVPVVVVLALATMLLGNLLALPQRSVKRMLAYSSIAHAGYLLLGLAAAGRTGMKSVGGESLLFYLAAYTLSAIGAFGVSAVMEREDADSPNAWDLDRFAGLARRRPMLAASMAVFLLSLAGIPPTVGFMGKLLVFRAAIDAGDVALAIFGVVTAAIGAYNYLRVIVFMYFRPSEPSTVEEPRMHALEWALGVACLLVFALGLGPDTLAELARRSAKLLF